MPAVMLNKEDIVKTLAVAPSFNMTGTMGSLNSFLATLDGLLKNPVVTQFIQKRFPNFNPNPAAIQSNPNPPVNAIPPQPAPAPIIYTAEMNYSDILSGVDALISGGFGQNTLTDVKTELSNRKAEMIDIIKKFKGLP